MCTEFSSKSGQFCRGATSGRFPSRNLKIAKVYSWVQKLKNVNPDISQEGYMRILGAFQAKNGCQSLTFEFPSILLNFHHQVNSGNKSKN